MSDAKSTKKATKTRKDPVAALAAEATTFAGQTKNRTRSGQPPTSAPAKAAKTPKAAPVKRTKTMAAVTEEGKKILGDEKVEGTRSATEAAATTAEPAKGKKGAKKAKKGEDEAAKSA